MRSVFIPEAYLLRKEVLTPLKIPYKGWGLILPADDLGKAIREGRVRKEVVTNNEFVYLEGELNDKA